MKREIDVLKLLNKNNITWCPKLLFSNNILFITNYCGERVSKNNIQKDYKIQAEKILSDLKKLNIKHNDIKKNEIFVKNNKIYLVDFGWISIKNNFNCGIKIDNIKKQYIIHDDNNLIKHLDYFNGLKK